MIDGNGMVKCSKHQSWNQTAKVQFPTPPLTCHVTLASSQQVKAGRPPPHLTNEAIQAQRDEVTCPCPSRWIVWQSWWGKPGLLAASSVLFPPRHIQSLWKGAYIPLLCGCMHARVGAHIYVCVDVSSWTFSQKHIIAEAPAQLSKSHFVRIRLQVSLCNLFPLPQ